MAHDLIAFGASADHSAALTDAVLLANESFFNGNGAAGTATQVFVKHDGYVFAHFTGDETAAQVEYRWHTTNDPDWNRCYNTRLQTTPWIASINRCMYPVKVGETLEVENQNGGAVFSGNALLIAKKPGDEIYDINVPRPGWLKPGDRFVRATATATYIADSWGPAGGATITWTNTTFDRTKKYMIVGVEGHSATGWCARFKYVNGPNVNDHPGFPLGDSAGTVPQHCMIFGDFGTFDGLNPPLLEASTVSGADAAVELLLIIREV